MFFADSQADILLLIILLIIFVRPLGIFDLCTVLRLETFQSLVRFGILLGLFRHQRALILHIAALEGAFED